MGNRKHSKASHRKHHVLWMALCAVVTVSTSSFWAQGQAILTELNPLFSPMNIDVHPAHREARSVIDELLGMSDSHTSALSTVEHVAALAEHQALRDRPIRPPEVHTLGRGESPLSVRQAWHIRTSEWAVLNPDIPEDAPEGTEVFVWRFDSESPPRSRSRPNSGRLVNGELMPDGGGWVVANLDHAYAASQTITGLIHAIRITEAEHPEGQDILIADLSRRRGGRFRPHRSHQSGRDVDVTYYNDTDAEPVWARTRAHELDLGRNWTFLRTLMTEHDIVYIFMSRRLQVPLFEYAVSIGEHPAFVASVFQYGPRGHRNHSAPIREASGHQDHMHIRFDCSDLDLRCRHVDYD